MIQAIRSLARVLPLVFLASAVEMAYASASPAFGQTPSSVALVAGRGAMAEVQVAVDTDDDRHIVAAADPYRSPVRIEVAESHDGATTWSAPVVLVPPGFDKSYDPSIVVVDATRIVVVGGASRAGRRFCQPDSVIFEATIVDGAVSYRTVSGEPSSGVYVDRPFAVRDLMAQRTIVTWTKSTGPGAECRATPIQSTIEVARSDGDGAYGPPTTVPSSGLPAPFGASIATEGDGGAWFVVGEHLPGRASRTVVVHSPDGGATFETPTVLDETADLPSAVPGVGGVFAPLPTIDVLGDGRVVAAWSRPTLDGLTVRLWQLLPGSTWAEMAAPGDLASNEMYPRVVAGPSMGEAWLLSAQSSGTGMDFVLRRHDGVGWSVGLLIASGASAPYLEVGQLLGLGKGAGIVVSAVPINGAEASLLQVVSVPAPPPPPPPPPPPQTTSASRPVSTEAEDRDAPTPTAAPPQDVDRGGSTLVLTAASVSIVASGLGLAIWLRHRASSRSRRSRSVLPRHPS